MYKRCQNHFLFVAVFFLPTTVVWAATFNIVYEDNGSFGFNAATSREPIGGNEGTTLGQQRRNVLEKAAEIWGQYLESDVEIEISAKFMKLGGDSSGTTLASAGPVYLYTDFDNQPNPETWYAAALANSLADSDLEENVPDIELTINESVDSNENVLNGAGFYYGYDNKPGDQANLLTTLLHEIGHGLGFISSIDPVNGNFTLEASGQQQNEARWPDSFSLLLKDTKTGKRLIDMADAERKEAVTNAPSIVFDGAYTKQASQRILRYRMNLADAFIDFKSFVLKLKNPTDPVSQFLKNRFNTSAQNLLEEYDESEEPSELLKNAIAEELNWVLQSSSIYETSRFDGISLSMETKQLLERDPEGDVLIFLNRLLLFDAYPQEIEKNRYSGGMLLTINGSEGFSGSFESAGPEFGLGVPPWGLSGQIVLVNDGAGENTSDACEEGFVNADEIRGRIALIDRGDCFFVDKVKRAQDAGAVAVVITNNIESGILNMGHNEGYTDIVIPSVFISKADGDLIKAALLEEKLRVFISNQAEFSGAQEGAVRVYTPTPAEFGSSLSHWSQDAFPDLLMEPESPRFFRPDLDLTLTVLRDIGWNISNIPFPHQSFELWANESINGAANGFDDDPDADGFVNLQEYAFGTHPEDAASVPSSVEFSSFSTRENVFALKYRRSLAPADIIFSVNKTNSLTEAFTEINGFECRQWNWFVDVDGFEDVEFRLESAAAKQFFNVEVKKYSQ